MLIFDIVVTRIVPDRERIFCPHCGHESLRKMSVSVDEKGEVTYYESRRPISLRGTKYSLPKPKAGRVNISKMPITCEDQLYKHGRRRKEKKVDPFDPEYVFASKGRRQAQGLGRRKNPNEAKRKPKGTKRR